MKEIRVYKCGCIDIHDAQNWASASCDPCKDHSYYEDDTLVPSDVCLAYYDGILFDVEE